jgi:predicted 3-demethylubiquinone-9 3-methyltransferase (glyoxalase superfamily)
MDKISPCLWFNNQAEEAVRFYISTFTNSSIDKISYYGDEGPGPKGTVMTVIFHLDSQELMALNGGPEYQFTPAISLVVYCKDQPEVDYYWERLSEGGEKNVCGWLMDRYGVSWQIVPTLLGQLIGDSDTRKAQGVMRAMLQMTKLNIAALLNAYDQA